MALTYNTAISCIEMSFNQHTSSMQFKEGLKTLLIAIQQYQVSNLLIDAAQVQSLSHDDEIWMTNHWLPKLTQLDGCNCAIVKSNYFDFATAMQRIVGTVNKEFVHMQLLDNKTEAIKWLKSHSSTYRQQQKKQDIHFS